MSHAIMRHIFCSVAIIVSAFLATDACSQTKKQQPKRSKPSVSTHMSAASKSMSKELEAMRVKEIEQVTADTVYSADSSLMIVHTPHSTYFVQNPSKMRSPASGVASGAQTQKSGSSATSKRER